MEKNISYKIEGDSLSAEGVRSFRSCLSAFSTGVVIVTTRSKEGEKVGLTINSFSSLSIEPPMVLWCLGKKSKSVPLFQTGRPFIINVLTDQQKHLAETFSSQNNDRFKDVALTGDPSGAPIIDGCISWFECEVADVFEGGDHYIITGRVTSFGGRKAEPLIFSNGQYGEIK